MHLACVQAGKKGRQNLDFGAAGRTYLRQIRHGSGFHGRYGNDDLIHPQFFHQGADGVSAPVDFDAAHDLAPFGIVVIDKAHYVPVVPQPDVPQNNIPGVPGAYDQDPQRFPPSCFPLGIVLGPAHKHAAGPDQKYIKEKTGNAQEGKTNS